MSNAKNKDWDVCIIGSGAGGGPVALTLAKAGYSVVILEKGPWFTEKDFYKDELACCRRSVYTPKLSEEQHVIEDTDNDGNWVAEATSDSGWDFWNNLKTSGCAPSLVRSKVPTLLTGPSVMTIWNRITPW